VDLKPLDRSFYNRDTVQVSRDLLGMYLVHNIHNQRLVGRIVETEAYKGLEDKAAHSYSGKITERNKVMFGPPGYAYVYLIYGMYMCMNIVTEPEGNPCAVLIRALEPVEGLNQMSVNRYARDYGELNQQQIKNISNGPGKLCIAMSITKQCYGEDLCGNVLFVAEPMKKKKINIVAAKRINIEYAEEAIHYPWRFYIKGNPFVSKI